MDTPVFALVTGDLDKSADAKGRIVALVCFGIVLACFAIILACFGIILSRYYYHPRLSRHHSRLSWNYPRVLGLLENNEKKTTFKSVVKILFDLLLIVVFRRILWL